MFESGSQNARVYGKRVINVPLSRSAVRHRTWRLECRCQALALAGDAALTDPVCDKSPEHQRIVELAAAEAPDFRYRRIGAED